MAPGNALTPQFIGLRSGTDHHRYGFDLPARAESVARARHLLRVRLAEWGLNLDEDTRGAAELIVSELFTNAVVHTVSERVLCELRYSGGQLRIAVEDQGHSPGEPQIRCVTDEESGRGLLLVDAMCSTWGAHDAEDGPGRVVWAELPPCAGRTEGETR